MVTFFVTSVFVLGLVAIATYFCGAEGGGGIGTLLLLNLFRERLAVEANGNKIAPR